MADRSLDREIAALALPAFGSLVAEPLYILADTAVVGRLGTEQLDGLALAAQPLLIGISVFIFLAYGTTAAVARLLGAGREGDAAHQAVQSLWLAFAIGIALIGVGWVATGPMLSALGGELGQPGPIRTFATTYLRISLFGVPAMLLMLAGVGYLRGLQDTVRPLIVAIGTAALNLVIELVLIYGFDQGIGASALATVIAQWVGAGLYLSWILRAVRAHQVSLRPDTAVLRQLSVVGRDLFLRTVALRMALVILTGVAARMGAIPLAAHEIAFAVMTVLTFGLDAIAIAGQAMIGRFLGADDVDGAKAAAKRMMQWAVGAGAVAALLAVAAQPFLPGVFSTDAAVVATAGFLFWHVAVQQPINALAFTLDGILIGAGDMAFLAKSMWVATVIFAPIAIAVGALDFGIGWLWATLAIFMALRAATLGWRLSTDRWLVTGA